MIHRYNPPQALNVLPEVANKSDFQTYIDGLSTEATYLFKCSSTAALGAGIAQIYGVLTAHIYSANAAILIFQPLTASGNLYKLRKYQGVWDDTWTQIKTTVVN